MDCSTGRSQVEATSSSDEPLLVSIDVPSSLTAGAEKAVAVAVTLAAAAAAVAIGETTAFGAASPTSIRGIPDSADGEFRGPVATLVIDSQVIRPLSSGGVSVAT